MESLLPTVWFVAIAVLWSGYLILEGFDLGVGMHMLVSAESPRQRRLMLNTIGPVWDGNEVWLLTAGAATFAAFPFWYASLFSALYLPLTLVLVGLILRAVGIEYRGKRPSPGWARGWDWAIGLGSAVTAFGIGAALAVTTTGLPLNERGDAVGGPFSWFSGYAVLGGLAVVGFSLVHGAAFLALKTDGPVRERSRRFVLRWAPVCLLPIVGWVLLVQLRTHQVWSWALVVVAVIAVLCAYLSERSGRERRAFAGMAVFLLAGAGSIFAAVFPVLLPSTLNHAWDLTVANASSSPYTLGVMTVVTAFGLPLVLVYQGWTYWVFRARLREEHLPEPTSHQSTVPPPRLANRAEGAEL